MNPRLGRLVVSALTYLGFAVIAAWIAERLAGTLRDTVTTTLETAAKSVSSTVADLGKLVGVVEPVDLIPQQTDDQWAPSAVVADETGLADIDDIDWTERAESEINPGIEPERIFLPREDRHVGPTIIAPPDLSAEQY